MRLTSTLIPWLSALLYSDGLQNVRRGWFRIKRTLKPSANKVIFFHRVDDPYSLLLLQVLPRFSDEYNVDIELRPILELPYEDTTNSESLKNYSRIDARRLSDFHDLRFNPDTPTPDAASTLQATSILIKHSDSSKALLIAKEVTSALWHSCSTTYESCIRRYGAMSEKGTKKRCRENLNLLINRGHYMGGTLYYGGEWYWGLDRIGHLAERLENEGLATEKARTQDYLKQYQHTLQSYNTLRRRPKSVESLSLYFSFRCPYSYIVMERLLKLAELYKVPVEMKPLLPLAQRGITVSKNKRRYMIKDAKREANHYQMPFGKICDPNTLALENCMALFYYAQEEGKEQQFTQYVCKGIWSQGLDMSKVHAMKKVIKTLELDWNEAFNHLETEHWQARTEKNHHQLRDLGLWGAPCFQYGDLILWGQDRLWALEDAILGENGRP